MPSKTGLILTGGGARAAYQVGVLGAIEDMRQAATGGSGNPYDVICGTSAGAINAAMLACGSDQFGTSLRLLDAVWRGFHTDQVYRSDVLEMIGSGARWLALLSLGWVIAHRKWRPRSLLDNSPLTTLLQMHIDTSRLPRLMQEGHLQALAITASSYSSGEHVTFYQSCTPIDPWVRNQRHAHNAPLTLDHLLASSAIPFIFPAVRLLGPHGCAYFGDGAMRQTAPISPAIHLGAERILVIGAGRMQEPSVHPPQEPDYPTLGQIAGHALSSIFLDALAVDLERLQRINQTLGLIDPSQRQHCHLRPVDLLVIAPTQRLDDIAAKHLHALPSTVRSFLRMLGASQQPMQGRALLSYLLFESAYTCDLLALGAQDAWRQKKEIHAFFGWPLPTD